MDRSMLFARILIRYLAGGLAISALIPADLLDLIRDDPDLAALVAAALAALVEWGRKLAGRRGWLT